jgi:N-acetylmuramoyl-L-alanine amidase
MRLLIICLILISASLFATEITNEYYLSNIVKDFDLTIVSEQCDNEFMTYSNQYDKIILKKFSRKMYFNNTLYWLNDAFSFSKSNGWFVAQQDYNRMLMPLFVADCSTNTIDGFVVFIDPGHGGIDSGACDSSCSTNLKESDIVFNISTNLASLLEEYGVTVVMSRTNDVYVGLTDRTAMANEAQAHMYISVHVNSAVGTSASGFETYTLPLGNSYSTSGHSEPHIYMGNNYDVFNSLLGYSIHNSMLESFPDQLDRGIKHARYEVLKNIDCPAILVECGFLSNKSEHKLLANLEYQRLVSESIFSGATNYIQSINTVDDYILENDIETIVYVAPAPTNNICILTNDIETVVSAELPPTNNICFATNDFQCIEVSSNQSVNETCEGAEIF